MIYRLLEDDPTLFPNPLSIPEDKREPSGLIAIGGDLSPERLWVAAQNGIFPWTDITAPEYAWYCPMQRFVIFPDEIHISHSIRNLINKNMYRVSIDVAFSDVIRNCSELRIHEEGAWLGEKVIQAYTKMHELGKAHSVEVWDNEDKLVGGLYGIWIQGVFIGESMFSLVPSGSKLALIYLAMRMQEIGGKFIDCQLETAHLKSMGGRYIPYEEYINIMWDVPKELWYK